VGVGVGVYIPKNKYDIEFQRTICKYICKKANKTLISNLHVLPTGQRASNSRALGRRTKEKGDNAERA
jgi:hypothetical protein